MEMDVYSEATNAILSFVNAEGTFQVQGSIFIIEAPNGVNQEKVGQLGEIIGQLRPRQFRITYNTNGIELEDLDSSLQTLEDFLMKLTLRLKSK